MASSLSGPPRPPSPAPWHHCLFLGHLIVTWALDSHPHLNLDPSFCPAVLCALEGGTFPGFPVLQGSPLHPLPTWGAQEGLGHFLHVAETCTGRRHGQAGARGQDRMWRRTPWPCGSPPSGWPLHPVARQRRLGFLLFPELFSGQAWSCHCRAAALAAPVSPAGPTGRALPPPGPCSHS